MSNFKSFLNSALSVGKAHGLQTRKLCQSPMLFIDAPQLHVPVGTLHPDIYSAYASQLAHHHARLTFKRLVVNVQTIGIEQSFVDTQNMFGTDCPCR